MPGGDYAAVVERRAPDRIRPGSIIDAHGRQLGRHAGIHHFTVGQRRRLGLASQVPLYVTKLDARSGEVTVGAREDLPRATLTASGVSWVAGQPPERAARLTVQIRYRHQPAWGVVEALAGAGARVTFDVPQRAVTPGQAAVFYDGDDLVGGGWID